MTVTKSVINGQEVINIAIPVIRRPSSSGKTVIVAGTGGFSPTAIIIDGKPVSISVNATIKA